MLIREGKFPKQKEKKKKKKEKEKQKENVYHGNNL